MSQVPRYYVYSLVLYIFRDIICSIESDCDISETCEEFDNLECTNIGIIDQYACLRLNRQGLY